MVIWNVVLIREEGLKADINRMKIADSVDGSAIDIYYSQMLR